MTRCYRIHARRRNCFEPPRTLVGRRTRTDRDGICPPPRDSPIDPSQIESPWRVSNLGPLDFESTKRFTFRAIISNRVCVCVLLRPLDSCTTTCAKIRVSGASGQLSPYPGSAHSVTRTAGDSRDGAKGHDNTTTAYTADMGTWVHGSEQTLQCHCKRAGEGSREMQAAG